MRCAPRYRHNDITVLIIGNPNKSIISSRMCCPGIMMSKPQRRNFRRQRTNSQQLNKNVKTCVAKQLITTSRKNSVEFCHTLNIAAPPLGDSNYLARLDAGTRSNSRKPLSWWPNRAESTETETTDICNRCVPRIRSHRSLQEGLLHSEAIQHRSPSPVPQTAKCL